MPYVVDRDDVRMVESRSRLRLEDESPHPLLVLNELLRKHLQRDCAIEPFIDRFVHLSHSAGSEGRQNPVVRKRDTAIERGCHEL
jgi:hypothetical protein